MLELKLRQQNIFGAIVCLNVKQNKQHLLAAIGVIMGHKLNLLLPCICALPMYRYFFLFFFCYGTQYGIQYLSIYVISDLI